MELNNERSRWRKQKNGLLQGSVLSPIMFNIYTNDQPIHDGTRNFIYADDLCVTAQYSSFTEVETTIGDALEELTQYYRSNSLRANPDKTQVTAFHLKNKAANRSLKVEWNRTKLENTNIIHMHNTKMNILRKLSNSKWGANASTIRTTVLALCYSVAEYAEPVCARSSHAQKLNPELNSACRAVTGCLKPTNVKDLYLLDGIALPDIRKDVCARVEKTKQETNEAPSLYGQNLTERRLKSRNCFLRSVKPADFPPNVIRCSAWIRILQAIPHSATVNIDESLAKGFDRPWTTWRCLN